MTQIEQRSRHAGFAMIPRTVIRGETYEHLSLLERGLYVGLKDICGETGECYYCLRNLAKELHTSISTLSRYIPKLKTAGLIEAEKKVRSTHNKHEVWHIRIVDIWAANDALYASKECFTEKQKSVSENDTLVATRKSVSDRNSSQAQSVSERNEDCFYLNAKEYLDSIDTLREKENLNSVSADAENATPSPSFSLDEQGMPPWHDGNEEDQRETMKVLVEAGIVPPVQFDPPPQVPSHPIASAAPASPAADETPPPAKKSAKPRGARQPRTPKKAIPPEMQTRIDAVFTCFDEVAREVTSDPEFTHARYQTSADEIRGLLEGRTITPDMLKAVYLAMWNKPAGTDGFTWKEHMSIKAVCRNFDTTWTAIKAKQPKKPKGDTGTPAPLLQFRSAAEADELEARKQRIRDAEQRKQQQPPQNVTPVETYQRRKVAHA